MPMNLVSIGGNYAAVVHKLGERFPEKAEQVRADAATLIKELKSAKDNGVDVDILETIRTIFHTIPDGLKNMEGLSQYSHSPIDLAKNIAFDTGEDEYFRSIQNALYAAHDAAYAAGYAVGVTFSIIEAAANAATALAPGKMSSLGFVIYAAELNAKAVGTWPIVKDLEFDGKEVLRALADMNMENWTRLSKEELCAKWAHSF
jgi:hypothetical protein